MVLITGEPEVRRCAGADADAETDTGAGLVALVLVLGEGCACETAGDFVGLAGAEAETAAMNTLDIEVARDPRVLRDADVYGSFWGEVLPSAASSRKDPRLGDSCCFGDAWYWECRCN